MEATLNDYEALWKQWRDTTIDGWSKVTREVVESDVFARSMTANLDLYLTGWKQMREGSAQFLDMLDLPRREDLARLSAQIASAETRVVECEERIDETAARLQELERRSAAQIAELQRRVAELEARPAVIQSENSVSEEPADKSKTTINKRRK